MGKITILQQNEFREILNENFQAFRKTLLTDIRSIYVSNEVEGEYCTINQARTLLNVSRQTIYDWRKSNKINEYWIGNQKRFKKSELLSLVRKAS